MINWQTCSKENYFEGSASLREVNRPQEREKNLYYRTEDHQGDNEGSILTSEEKEADKNMAKSGDPVSFVVGDPEPDEELETEDRFPGSESDPRINQQSNLLPGLAERRKRLRWLRFNYYFASVRVDASSNQPNATSKPANVI